MPTLEEVDAPAPEGAESFGQMTLTWHVEHYDELPSTQDVALERIRIGMARPGELVVAARQTAGRGRRGRTWVSAAGALHATAILPVPDEGWEWTGIAAALAIAQGLRALGVPAGVKWPNDVVDESGRKLAGLLLETAITGDLVSEAVLGVGVNVNWPLTEMPSEIAERAPGSQLTM